MAGVIVALVAAGASLIAVINLVFSTEILAGLGLHDGPPAPGIDTDTVIVIPANDEAAIIGKNLARLRQQLVPGHRILVVADNCSDDTATAARAGGADVIVRDDRSRTGKGYALAYARDHLIADAPDIVVVLDADCTAEQGCIARLVHLALTQDRPVQAVSLLSPDLCAPPMVQVSNFAFAVKNRLRNGGLYRLTGRGLLTGTGMAFPWHLFRSASLATNNVVEDLALGLDLSARGRPPMFVPGAVVWSAASNTGGTLKQRTRWEGGFLSTSVRQSAPMIGRALRAGDPRSLWQGLSLLVPPLSLLAVANILAATVALAIWPLLGSPVPLLIIAASGGVACVTIGMAWRRMGRPYLSVAAARTIPLYVLWKLPLYLNVLKRSPRAWLRSGR